MDLRSDLRQLVGERCRDVLRQMTKRLMKETLARVQTRIQKRVRRPCQPRFPERTGAAKWAVAYEDVEWFLVVKRLRSAAPRDIDKRTFRRCFRVSFNVFEELFTAAKTSGEFAPVSSTGKPPVPLELKILGVLRYNAVGGNWDVISEASGGVSIKTFSTFHSKYME